MGEGSFCLILKKNSLSESLLTMNSEEIPLFYYCVWVRVKHFNAFIGDALLVIKKVISYAFSSISCIGGGQCTL